MKSPFDRFTAILFFASLAFVNASEGARRPGVSLPSPDDILERSRAKYAALRSYADTGVITTEDQTPGGPAVVERHLFTTYYRAPRQFFFEFKEDARAGGEQFVIWCDGGDFNTWWSTTRVHDTYAKGRGALAFALAVLPTKGSAAQIPPLLFSQAGLQGPVTGVKDPRPAGTEDVASRPCHKLIAEVGLAYGTGNVTSVRSTTIWIDAETLLVRKVLEDTPSGTPRGIVSRVLTTFEPLANPDLDDARFRFAVPR